ncbi:MAG: hypothetical protein HC888_10180 [Candidatus Competibacteraceae bacterium]|nr:hypothetical protein [Candidatus Competibacteraceae bacterium]
MVSDQRPLLALCTASILLGAVLRFALLNTNGFWLDEMMQMQVVSHPTFAEMLRAVPPDKLFLDYILLRLWGKESSPEWYLRLPSLFFSLATIGCLWWAGRPWKPLWLGAAVFALNPLSIHLAQELLPYSSATFFLCFSFVSLGLFAKSQYWRWAVATCGGALLLSLTNFLASTALPTLVIAAAMLAFRNRSKGHAVVAAVLAGVFCFCIGMLWVRMAGVLSSPVPWPFPGPFHLTVHLAEALAFKVPGPLAWASIAVFIVLAFGIARVWNDDQELAIILFCWLFVGLALRLLALALTNHWLARRYLLDFTVPASILIGYGLAPLAGKPWRLGAALVALAALGVPGLLMLKGERASYREGILSVPATARSVLVDSGETAYCYNFYRWVHFPHSPPAFVYERSSAETARALFELQPILLFPVVSSGYAPPPDFARLLSENPEPVSWDVIAPAFDHSAEVSNAEDPVAESE